MVGGPRGSTPELRQIRHKELTQQLKDDLEESSRQGRPGRGAWQVMIGRQWAFLNLILGGGNLVLDTLRFILCARSTSHWPLVSQTLQKRYSHYGHWKGRLSGNRDEATWDFWFGRKLGNPYK